jgi:hypothetical protein
MSISLGILHKANHIGCFYITHFRTTRPTLRFDFFVRFDIFSLRGRATRTDNMSPRPHTSWWSHTNVCFQFHECGQVSTQQHNNTTVPLLDDVSGTRPQKSDLRLLTSLNEPITPVPCKGLQLSWSWSWLHDRHSAYNIVLATTSLFRNSRALIILPINWKVEVTKSKAHSLILLFKSRPRKNVAIFHC